MRECHWNTDEINFLKQHYQDMTNKEIGNILDRSKSAVDLKMRRLNLKKTKYNYNKDFFSEIDTEEKAYWLGFIYADGCVSWKKETNSCELSIKLQAGDFNHLKKFNKSISGNVGVTFFKRKAYFGENEKLKKYNGKEYSGCQIRLYSKKIVFDLINHDVFTNKSHIIEFPKLNENLIQHFIRGFFDGDGCICENKKKKGLSSISCNFTCGSEIFVKELREYLNNLNINAYISKEQDKPYRLSIGGMKNCDRFLHYIYDNSTLYLDRKFNKKERLYNSLNIEQRLLR